MQMRLRRGAETISLSGGFGAIVGCTYLQQTSHEDNQEISETIEIVLDGALADILSSLRAVELWLGEARLYQERSIEERVYLDWDIENSGDWYQSEILGGTVQRGNSLRVARSGAMIAGLVVTRRNYWEGAEVAIPLTNGNGTASISGINVFDCNDGAGSSPNKRHNYVAVSGADVDGTRPGACRLELTAGQSGTYGAMVIGVGNNLFSHNHEAPSSANASVGASGGYFRRVSIGAGGTVYVQFTLPTIADYLGEHYLGVLRLNATPTPGTRVKMYLENDFADISETILSEFKKFHLLGGRRIPQTRPDYTTQNLLDISLKNASVATVDLDTLTLLPTRSFVKLDFGFSGVGEPVTAGEKVHIHPLQPAAWMDSGSIRRILSVSGPGIFLEPGKNQKLVFAWANDSQGYGWDIGDRVNVKIWHRPRRLTL